jgi:hypothetical protein
MDEGELDGMGLVGLHGVNFANFANFEFAKRKTWSVVY